MRAPAALRRFGREGVGPYVIAVLLLVGLFAAMAVQPTRQLLAQKERIADMANELERLEATNSALEQHIERLNDPDYIEQEARSQIGLARPGETVYVVMPPRRHKKGRAGGHPPKARVATAPEPGFFEGLRNFLGL